MTKKHWYALSYRGKCLQTGYDADAVTYVGYPEKLITLDRIKAGKADAGVKGDAALICASYLGYMTKKAFIGSADDQEQTK